MSLSVDLICVDPAEVRNIWPKARTLIKTAIEATGLSEFGDIETDVLCGNQLLWLAISDHVEAAAVTHLIKTPTKPVLILTAVSGHHRDRWLSLRKEIEAYAKAEGCRCVRLYGRKGWQRVLKDYHVQYVIMEKPL